MHLQWKHIRTPYHMMSTCNIMSNIIATVSHICHVFVMIVKIFLISSNQRRPLDFKYIAAVRAAFKPPKPDQNIGFSSFQISLFVIINAVLYFSQWVGFGLVLSTILYVLLLLLLLYLVYSFENFLIYLDQSISSNLPFLSFIFYFFSPRLL